MPVSYSNDNQLVASLRAGNEQAFNEIYERYWKSLFMFARKRLNSEEEALDLLQDMFASLWLKRESLLISSSLSGYLFKALKNRMLDHYKATYTREAYLASLQKYSVPFQEATEQALMGEELRQLLHAATEALPEKMKAILKLSRSEEKSIQEISLELQLSEQTVKNQLTNALKRLRIELGDYLPLLVLVSWLY